MAGIEGLETGELVGATFDRVGEPRTETSTVRGGHRPPPRERGSGRGHGPIYVPDLASATSPIVEP